LLINLSVALRIFGAYEARDFNFGVTGNLFCSTYSARS